jgi:hypothetical protein
LQVEARLRQLEGRALAADSGKPKAFKSQPAGYDATKQQAAGTALLSGAAGKAYNAAADVVEPAAVAAEVSSSLEHQAMWGKAGLAWLGLSCRLWWCGSGMCLPYIIVACHGNSATLNRRLLAADHDCAVAAAVGAATRQSFTWCCIFVGVIINMQLLCIV